MSEGLANQSGRTNIKLDPLQLQAQAAVKAGGDNKNKLQALMEDYGIKKNKDDTEYARKTHAEDKASDRNFKQQMLDLQKMKMSKEKSAADSAGQKELDKGAAKEYQDWSSGGSKIAQSEIGKLKSALDKLKSGKVKTGGLTGMFPDQLTSNDVLSARSDIQSSVMGSLRALLGAQFTEKEGERVIKNTWNEADSTENNVARVERLVNDLEAKSQDKNQKAKYFQDNNSTLKGFQAQPLENVESSNVKVRDPQGNIRMIPRSKLQQAIKAGGTLAE